MVDTHIFLPGKMRRKRATNRRLSFSAKKLLFLRGRAAKAPQGADSRTITQKNALFIVTSKTPPNLSRHQKEGEKNGMEGGERNKEKETSK